MAIGETHHGEPDVGLLMEDEDAGAAALVSNPVAHTVVFHLDRTADASHTKIVTITDALSAVNNHPTAAVDLPDSAVAGPVQGEALSPVEENQETMLTVSEMAELVTNAQRGSREAFNEISTHFQPVVFAIVLRRLRNRAVAFDVAQEVFLQVWIKLRGLREPERFAGWIKQIAVRMAINHAVRTHRMFSFQDPEVLSALSSLSNHPDKRSKKTPQPLAALLHSEEVGVMHELLDELGDINRRTLISFYLNDQSLKQMAVEFAAPIGTIKRRLHTARNKLRDLFIQRGFVDLEDLPS